VYLRQEAAIGQRLEVAADRHVRDAVLGGQLADPDAARGPDPVEDGGLALLSEHQQVPAQ
jgi:hypothetical protein